MDGIFQKALKDLTETQIDFLCEEFALEKSELMGATEDILDSIYDDLCEIEVDETIDAGNGELSDRGKIVSDIVTTFGNAIAEACGYGEDFEDDLNE